MKNAVQKGYDQWAATYDTVDNKTRDLDQQATQQVLRDQLFTSVLELGCGTGKNTVWLAQKATNVTAVDFSKEMLEKAIAKVTAPHVQFQQMDITKPWPFEKETFDLITCNLILEHIEHLPPVFSEAMRVLQPGGKFFISELHPYKQYAGSKARFEQDQQTVVLVCYVHPVSAFFGTARQHGFYGELLQEWFDDESTNSLPRLITFLFAKPQE